jgi:hypothetical protein
MPLLAYCITDTEFDPGSTLTVGTEVQNFTEGALRCYTSQFQPKSDNNAAAIATRFHHALQDVLAGVAIVPFRFPTLADETELRSYLREHQDEYLELLRHFQDFVQMEVRIISASFTAHADEQASGLEYLKNRQARAQGLEQAAASMRLFAGNTVEDWHDQPVPQGLRCYALVKRSSILRFRDIWSIFVVPQGFNVRVSGPWPTTEFMPLAAIAAPLTQPPG